MLIGYRPCCRCNRVSIDHPRPHYVGVQAPASVSENLIDVKQRTGGVTIKARECVLQQPHAIDMDHPTLGAAIKSIADEHWQQRRQPVFLSSLPPLIEAKGLANYKEILGGQTLKQFLKDTGPTYGCKLVEHPTLRAKLALVPLDVPFDFASEVPKPLAVAITQADVETFFRVLTFVAEDGSNLMLPASVVAKLIAIR